MSEDQAPFFTPNERKATAIFRPHEWVAWWRPQPLAAKLLSLIVVGGLLTLAVSALAHGDQETGWFLIGLIGYLLALAVFVASANLLAACFRWTLRKCGMVALWHKIGAQVLATTRFAFWAFIFLGVVIAFWPYLSLDPVKSWYALQHRVPVERVAAEKKPHDCEFDTALLMAA